MNKKKKLHDRQKANHQVRAFALDEKSKFDDEKLTITGVVISSKTEDRHGTTFNPAGCDHERFDKNPVLMLNHNTWDDLPIGRVENIRQDGDCVLGDAVFEDVTKEEKGKDVYSLLKNGFLNAFSIGFNVLRYGNEKKGECTFEEWELREVSVVNIPSNPDAVVKRSAEEVADEEVENTADVEVEETTDEETSTEQDVEIDDVRAIVFGALSDLRKVDETERFNAEAKEQFTTDLRAALANSYKTLGKTLKVLKENKN
jgi:HK97 family phage prohead protease